MTLGQTKTPHFGLWYDAFAHLVPVPHGWLFLSSRFSYGEGHNHNVHYSSLAMHNLS